MTSNQKRWVGLVLTRTIGWGVVAAFLMAVFMWSAWLAIVPIVGLIVLAYLFILGLDLLHDNPKEKGTV